MADETQPDVTQPAAPVPEAAPEQPVPAPAPEQPQEPAPAAPEAPAEPAPAPESPAPAEPQGPLEESPAQPASTGVATTPGRGVPTNPVTVNNYTRRDDSDALEGGWVDVVDGPYAGRYGAYVQTTSHSDENGYPQTILVRTRDARNELIEVEYAHVRPSERTGGR